MKKFNLIEEQIMQILWKIKKGFPKEIMTYMTEDIPYNTILSTIRKLEKEGFLGFQKFGKSHQYFPLVAQKDYNRSLFKNLYNTYLKGSKEQLLSFFMEEEEIDINEIDDLLKKLKEKEDNKN